MIALDRRRVMGVGSVTPLPYDAEVEYLESNGKQWIDTGIHTNKRTYVNVKFVQTAKSTVYPYYSAICGAYASSKGTPRFLYYINGSLKVAGNNFSTVSGPANGTTITANTEYTLRIYNTGNYDQANLSVYIFAAHNDNSVKLYPSDKLQICSCSIEQNDATVRDYIPVRVGTTGYMYDKKTKTLYANEGTEDFILGPDKT